MVAVCGLVAREGLPRRVLVAWLAITGANARRLMGVPELRISFAAVRGGRGRGVRFRGEGGAAPEGVGFRGW